VGHTEKGEGPVEPDGRGRPVKGTQGGLFGDEGHTPEPKKLIKQGKRRPIPAYAKDGHTASGKALGTTWDEWYRFRHDEAGIPVNAYTLELAQLMPEWFKDVRAVEAARRDQPPPGDGFQRAQVEDRILRMARYVTIYEAGRGVTGRIVLADGRLRADPPEDRLLPGILEESLLVRVDGRMRQIHAKDEPELFLRMLSTAYHNGAVCAGEVLEE